MNNIPLVAIGSYTPYTPFDRYHFETFNLVNEFINTLEAIQTEQDFVGASLDFEDGQFIALLVPSGSDPLLAFCQTLGLSPDDVQNWLANFIDNSIETVVELGVPYDQLEETSNEQPVDSEREMDHQTDNPLRDTKRKSGHPKNTVSTSSDSVE